MAGRTKSIATELGGIHQWMRDHERHDDARFASLNDNLGKLPTKDDLGSIDRKLDEIHTQVKYTNGRVNTLERWRSYITGGLTVLSLLLVPVVLYVITKSL